MVNRKLFVEFVGTFTLIFIGAGAAAMVTAEKGNLVSVGLAHGCVVIALIYAYGDISGVHINPAVTLGFYFGKKINMKEAISYWGAQFLGGVMGAAFLRLLLDGFIDIGQIGLGNTVPAAGVNQFQALIIEIILTFLLVAVIFETTLPEKSGKLAAMIIGITLISLIMMGGPLTGASLNPMRTIGPALMTLRFDALWLYIVGPLAGGALAASFHHYLRAP